MLSGSVIFYKIASMCLLIFVGYMTRRMKLVPENFLSALSHFIIKVATPCYILMYIPQSVSRETVLHYWYFPLLGGALAAFCDVTGWVTARLFARDTERATFRLLAAFPNWVFLALAVIEPMFGIDGLRVVLLFNVGITIYLWSFGLTGFRKGLGWVVVKNLFLNVQLLSTVLGVTLALTVPFLARAHHLSASELAALPVHLGLVATVWEAITLIGATSLALSIFQIGLRLAGTASGKTVADLTERSDNRTLVLCTAVRLLLSPALSIALLLVLIRLGVPLTPDEYLISVIIFAMPTAVVSLSITDVYGGDTLLAARAVLWMTVASMATVPLTAYLAQATLAVAYPK